MSHVGEILLSILIVLFFAQLGGFLFSRLGVPRVVGEISAGILVGPSALAILAPGKSLELLSELGAVLLLCSVGLENRLSDLLKVGKAALLVGVLGVIVPFATAFFWGYQSGFQLNQSLFIASAFIATSAGITARVLQEIGAIKRLESRIILGAAIIDDVLAMLIVGVVTVLLTERNFDITVTTITLLKSLGFVFIASAFAVYFIRWLAPYSEKFERVDVLVPSALILTLALSVASTYVGLAPIIGAFIAGLALAELKIKEELEGYMHTIGLLVVPFFFIHAGLYIDLKVFMSLETLILLLIVTVLAILSKLVGGALGAMQLGFMPALRVGVGMIPRGEVGIIVASLGKQLGVIDTKMFSVLVAMSLITSVVTPPVLKYLFKEKI